MSDFQTQVERMKALYNYGKVNESSKKVSNRLEHQEFGADGMSYAIIKENSKYFIKVAPKDKALVAEAYGYIGGWNNHKDYEYNSYNSAVNHFNIKMHTLNEAYGAKVDTDDASRFMKNDILTECTEQMKKEIARQRQIMYNAAAIMNEAATIGYTISDPEGEAKATDPVKQGDPYEEKAKAELDGDFKKTAEKPENVGAPYSNNPKKSEEGKDANVEDSVASAHPQGGKTVKMNEGFENGETDFAEGLPEDGAAGTSEVGDGTPYVETVNEGDDIAGLPAEDDDIDVSGIPAPEEDGKEGVLEEDELDDLSDDEIDLGDDEDVEDVDLDDEAPEADVELGDEVADDEAEPVADEYEELKARIASLEAKIAELEAGDCCDDADVDVDVELDAEPVDGEDELADDEAADDEFAGEDEFADDEFADDEDLDECGGFTPMLESVVSSVISDFVNGKLNEENLNVWGKHPGYRKKPMTLPETGKDETEHGRDWNDDSVHSEEPFGKKIGDGTPFTLNPEKIADSILEILKKKLN